MTVLSQGPLSGIRVLDLTNVLAGPYCCYQLALMGAEVIKVERPGTGDLARQLGADPQRNAANMGISFLAQNAQKSSITLNLKSDEGRALFLELLKTSQVVVENFRPGVMKRLNLGYPTLAAIVPELIYCAISGFGQDGPRAGDPAYDQIVQGISGAMSVTGDAQTAPYRTGYPIADTLGGMTAAFAIVSALNARHRGDFLDVSMTDAVMSSMGWVVSNHLIGGALPAAHGNENPTSAPSGTFATKDGLINIAANRDSQWESLARLLGVEALIDDPRFLTREDRKTNRLILRDLLENSLIQAPSDHWLIALSELGVPAGPVHSVPQALADPQIAGRGLISNVMVEGQAVPVSASPVVRDNVRPTPNIPPPQLGADNRRISQELGLTEADLEDLNGRGVI